MVSPVTSSPYYSYLNQLQAAGQSTTAATTDTGSGTSTSSTGQSLVSSLLGGGYTPELLSLLQGSSNGSFNAITDLLGGSGSGGALTSLYTNLYDTAEAATLTQAQEANPAQTSAATNPATVTSCSGTSVSSAPTGGNIVQSLINQQIQASVAYNNTLQQNVSTTVNSIINA